MPRVSLLCLVGCLSACVLCLSACATHLLHTARTLERGATPAQVREVLGTPHDRQFHGPQEAWQYCETGVLQDTFVVVWFVDRQVTKISTYHNGVWDLRFFCGRSVPAIRWQDARRSGASDHHDKRQDATARGAGNAPTHEALGRWSPLATLQGAAEASRLSSPRSMLAAYPPSSPSITDLEIGGQSHIQNFLM